MWIKLPLQALAGLNISDNSLTPSMAAYLADTFEKEYRTIAFGLAYAVGGIGLLVGATTAILVEIFWDVETNFLVITMFNVLQLLWIILFLPESLDRKDRKPLTQKSIQNPLRPLWQARSHPIAIWISIVQLCASLPESGIVEISTTVILVCQSIINRNHRISIEYFYQYRISWNQTLIYPELQYLPYL